MVTFPVLEVFHDDTPRSAAMNMALDEVFWQRATSPQLRFYEWDHPALTFGYFGRYSDVAEFEAERELMRRCTGGGIVFHGADLTYALIIPAHELPTGRSPTTVYRIVHEAIKSTLDELGVEAALVAADVPKKSADFTSACFANPVAADVVVREKKVAGAAQRRSRRGLLQQGSIQNIPVPNDFRERFLKELCSNSVVREIDSSTLEEGARLADEKYATEAWLKRR